MCMNMMQKNMSCSAVTVQENVPNRKRKTVSELSCEKSVTKHKF